MTKQLKLLGDQGSFSTVGSSNVGICYLLMSDIQAHTTFSPSVSNHWNIIYPFLSRQARGIDVQQVSLVINYDLPTNRENYIHR